MSAAAQEQIAVAVDDAGVGVSAGGAQGLLVGWVLIFPCPERSAIDAEKLGDLAVVVALDGELDGPGLDVGDVEIGFDIIKNPRRSQVPGVGLRDGVGETFVEVVGSGFGR